MNNFIHSSLVYVRVVIGSILLVEYEVKWNCEVPIVNQIFEMAYMHVFNSLAIYKLLSKWLELYSKKNTILYEDKTKITFD